MKRNLLIVVGLVAISVFLISAGSIITQPENKFPEKEITIALRNVGHRLLLHAGDSTSRVLPIKQIDKSSYQIEFQSSFAFVPDSLVKIVQQSLMATRISINYTVNVLECSTNQIVYGFQIGNNEQTTLVPCLGREQPKGCYIILLSFLQDSSGWQKNSRLALALVSLVVVGFVSHSFARKKIITESSPSVLQIGRYEFYENQRMLKFDKTTIDLSDKEAQLLKMFAGQMNKSIAREVLMKEIWQDNGALISRSLDVFVSRLRKKLKDDPAIQIMNVHGVGYKMIDRIL